MHHYGCKSKLNISCQTVSHGRENTCTITIWLEHHKQHPPYYDMTLPLKAVESRKNWNGQHQVKWLDIYKPYIQLCWPAGPQGMDDNEQDPVEEGHRTDSVSQGSVNRVQRWCRYTHHSSCGQSWTGCVGDEKGYGPSERENHQNWD